MSEWEELSDACHNFPSSPMCRKISSGASWSGDSASTGSFIDECLANLIVFTYGMPLLEHAYQTPATLKRFKHSSRLVIPAQQESLAGEVGGWGAAGPRRREGKARIAKAQLKHGRYVNWRERRAKEKAYFRQIRMVMRQAKEAGLIEG